MATALEHRSFGIGRPGRGPVRPAFPRCALRAWTWAGAPLLRPARRCRRSRWALDNAARIVEHRLSSADGRLAMRWRSARPSDERRQEVQSSSPKLATRAKVSTIAVKSEEMTAIMNPFHEYYLCQRYARLRFATFATISGMLTHKQQARNRVSGDIRSRTTTLHTHRWRKQPLITNRSTYSFLITLEAKLELVVRISPRRNYLIEKRIPFGNWRATR